MPYDVLINPQNPYINQILYTPPLTTGGVTSVHNSANFFNDTLCDPDTGPVAKRLPEDVIEWLLPIAAKCQVAVMERVARLKDPSADYIDCRQIFSRQEILDSNEAPMVCTLKYFRENGLGKYAEVFVDNPYHGFVRGVTTVCRLLELPVAKRPEHAVEVKKLKDCVRKYMKRAYRKDKMRSYGVSFEASIRFTKMEEAGRSLMKSIGANLLQEEVFVHQLLPAIIDRVQELNRGVSATAIFTELHRFVDERNARMMNAKNSRWDASDVLIEIDLFPAYVIRIDAPAPIPARVENGGAGSGTSADSLGGLDMQHLRLS